MWKIEKIVSKGDYNYAVVKDHPYANSYGYVLEHRVVVEISLGRILNPDEVVHHKNGNKKDNRLENLEIMDAISHSSLHSLEKGVSLVRLKCPECCAVFVRPKRQTFLVKKKNSFTCCSISCRGKFSRKIQLYGITNQVELAISENIVLEFNSNDNPEQTVKQQDA